MSLHLQLSFEVSNLIKEQRHFLKPPTPLWNKNFINPEAAPARSENSHDEEASIYEESSKLIKSDLGSGTSFFLARRMKTKFMCKENKQRSLLVPRAKIILWTNHIMERLSSAWPHWWMTAGHM